jgi:hypothetical protein
MKMKLRIFLFVCLALWLAACRAPELSPPDSPDVPSTDTPEGEPPETSTETPGEPNAPPVVETSTGKDQQPSQQPIMIDPLPTKDGPPKIPPKLPIAPSELLSGLVEQAKQDLSQRFSISADQISVIQAREVTWPDSGLGCPQPGMMYLMVLSPGYQIILNAGAREYHYHAGHDAEVFYCANPSPPVPGEPVDM